MQILGFTLAPQVFIDTNMLVSQMYNSRVRDIAEREPQMREILSCSGI